MRRHSFLVPILASLAVAAGALAPFTAPLAAQEREQPPGPGPLRPFVLPEIRETRLANGLRVVVVERPALPLVHARIIVDAGAVHEPAASSGLAVLTGALLVEGGAGGMNAAEFAALSEALGVSIGSSASFSLATVSTTSLRDVFPQALALAAAAARDPMFDAREFERVRTQSIAAFERSMATVEGIAGRIFPMAVYASDAPYSRSPSGSAATLRALTHEDVVGWYRRMYTPAATTVLLVGDISFADAVALVQQRFGDWAVPPSGVVLPPNPVQPRERTRVILVDRPGSVQSAIYVGVPAIANPDPDFFRMTVLDRILGGQGFTSRINLNLRERRGFTYGAFTVLSALQNAGSFYAVSSVRTDATDSSLAEVVHEFRAIVNERVPEDELFAAVNNLVAGFPASLQTVQELAGRLQPLIIYELPLDYYATYRERLAAVTATDVMAVARRYLTPDALTMVVVGDLAQIEAPIRARNFGDVEVWDLDGNRLR